jgi:hypothetical protein
VNVTLTLTSLSGLNLMWVSNDPNFATSTGTGWIPFQATYPWTLTPGLGNKTVYVSFGNTATAVPTAGAETSITVVGGQVLGATTSGGQVLGASAFNFTSNLSLGSSGNDVTNLQNLLTQEGFYTGPVTGYFGPLTQAAVKAYQLKHGLPNTGFVGPLTRAQLNSGQVLGASTTGTEAIQAQIASLQAQLLVLLKQLAAMIQAQK